MHRLAREEKLRGKKLRGKRKRKESEREKAPGQDFRLDVADERFAAVLEGDTRFGIDRTDSSFKVGGKGRGRSSLVLGVFARSTSADGVVCVVLFIFSVALLSGGICLCVYVWV